MMSDSETLKATQTFKQAYGDEKLVDEVISVCGDRDMNEVQNGVKAAADPTGFSSMKEKAIGNLMMDVSELPPEDPDDLDATRISGSLAKELLAKAYPLLSERTILSNRNTNAIDNRKEGSELPPEDRNEPAGTESFPHADSHPIPGNGFSIPTRPLPGPPGWGCHPDEEILHRVPNGFGPRKRSVFRIWPRDPQGKKFVSSRLPETKLSPDGFTWGATLYDFFHVRRVPPLEHSASIMTSGQILQFMKEFGELDFAKDEIQWAVSEPDPKVEVVARTDIRIHRYEMQAKDGSFDQYSMLDHVRKPALLSKQADQCSGSQDDCRAAVNVGDTSADGIGSGEDVNPVADPTPISPPLPTDIPESSPFHPMHYPAPWPFIPFTNLYSVFLQERIPFYLLPQVLHVHDPFNVLSITQLSAGEHTWNSKPDILHTYNLTLLDGVRDEANQAMRKAEEIERYKASTRVVLRYEQTQEQMKNGEPIIEVVLPRYPPRRTKVEESHLYLSPVGIVGTGHHSDVYEAEWELPRDLFIVPNLCDKCFEESVEKEIQSLKDTGRWDMMRAATREPNRPIEKFSDAARLEKGPGFSNLPNCGKTFQRELTCWTLPGVPPTLILKLLDDRGAWEAMMHHGFERDSDGFVHFTSAQHELRETEPEGRESRPPVPIMRINPPVSYPDPCKFICSHQIWPSSPVPRTTGFTVVAKLSIPHDHHLAREATNYQQFPDHFFQHYSGYTFMPQLQAIVPMGAIVPQFYGYYTPALEPAPTPEDQGQGKKPYLSPILLLEHCGRPIKPSEMSVDDQEECASLLLRFQTAGWVHESVAPRNFLVQLRRPTELPMYAGSKDVSFRLIDFGRSRKAEGEREKWREWGVASTVFCDIERTMRCADLDN